MSNNDKAFDDDIDLLALFETIWDGKWKIASIMAISLLSILGFNTLVPNKTFTAKTEIKPITSFELDKYRLFNSSLKKINSKNVEINIYNISRESLLALYVEQLEEGSLFETGIKKFKLLNKDNFENENDYKEAIQKFASEIQILRPINVDRKAKGLIRSYHELSAEYDDVYKWKKLIMFVDSEANRKVKNIIVNRFKTIVNVQEQIKVFSIQDIDTAIENVQKDYDRSIKDKLAFLSEQAAIARKLGVKKNTIESQMFVTQNTVVTNVKTETPFYLRGYEAIEEEINQIKNRKDKAAFIGKLFELENRKRKILQDQTIQRAVSLFDKTPLNQTDFRATIVKAAATDFELKSRRNLFYALALILGGIIGVVYVLISKALVNRKALPTQS
ncbi:hypothetical protein OAQ56_02140 [Alphaproteobacteria bacterium]|nr:hypothetical protein [Alphaproteobacteria bacterium]